MRYESELTAGLLLGTDWIDCAAYKPYVSVNLDHGRDSPERTTHSDNAYASEGHTCCTLFCTCKCEEIGRMRGDCQHFTQAEQSSKLSGEMEDY